MSTRGICFGGPASVCAPAVSEITLNRPFKARKISNMNYLTRYSTVTIALAMLAAMGCASTPKQASTGQYIDDSVITAKVKAAVFDDAALKSAEINVETFKGTVQLSGFVDSLADINKAASIAREIKGVAAVKNDMQVKGQ